MTKVITEQKITELAGIIGLTTGTTLILTQNDNSGLFFLVIGCVLILLKDV